MLFRSGVAVNWGVLQQGRHGEERGHGFVLSIWGFSLAWEFPDRFSEVKERARTWWGLARSDGCKGAKSEGHMQWHGYDKAVSVLQRVQMMLSIARRKQCHTVCS